MHSSDLSTGTDVSVMRLNCWICNETNFVMQALAERRKLRSQSGGSSTEVFAVPEPPVVPPKDAKARVRFAVEEGEAPGDKPPDPEVPSALPLLYMLQGNSALLSS